MGTVVVVERKRNSVVSGLALEWANEVRGLTPHRADGEGGRGSGTGEHAPTSG